MKSTIQTGAHRILAGLLSLSLLAACSAGKGSLPSAADLSFNAQTNHNSTTAQGALTVALTGKIFLPYQKPEYKQPPVTGHYNTPVEDNYAFGHLVADQSAASTALRVLKNGNSGPNPTPTPIPSLAPTPTPSPRPVSTAKPRPRVTPTPLPTRRPGSELPDDLRGFSASVDGAVVPIRITGYWLPEDGESTILDYEIPQAQSRPGYQVLEIHDAAGKRVGGAIIQLQDSRTRVYDVNAWSSAMLKLARYKESHGGPRIQLLRQSEIQRMGLAPELEDPEAYLAKEEDAKT